MSDNCNCGHVHHAEEESKYDFVLAEYSNAMGDNEVAAAVKKLIEERVEENNTVEVKKFLFNCIDLTTLKCTDSEESVMQFTEKVNEFDDKHPDLKNVAAICVYPNFAKIVNDTLQVENVGIACVSGGFPSSQTFQEIKVAETAMAIHDGATEIDIVLSVGKFLSGDYEGVCDEIEELESVCGEKHLKVILETGLLRTMENIAQASFLAMEAGADFIKTSTGKVDVNATPSAAYVMCECIARYHDVTGKKIGFKPAGGISSAADALCYYSIVSSILGKEWLNKELFRFGVSRVANNILSTVEQKTVNFF
jgi:deoxyribose-phosphate aldolase